MRRSAPGYGPIVVARRDLSLDELRDVEIAVPGRLTTAFLVLGMALGAGFAHRALPFDRILDAVKSGDAEAGLLIHEGQLTYADEGLVNVLDLGKWWLLETGLPLPLGVNVARRDVAAARRAVGSVARVDRGRARATAKRRRRMHSVLRATSLRRPRTGSSRCT